MRLTVRVRPGAPSTRVGGRYGTTDPPVLVVHVQAPAVDGRANDALVEALAEVFHLRRASVRIVSGLSSRTKVVDLDGGSPELLVTLLEQEPLGKSLRGARPTARKASHCE